MALTAEPGRDCQEDPGPVQVDRRAVAMGGKRKPLFVQLWGSLLSLEDVCEVIPQGTCERNGPYKFHAKQVCRA